MFCRGAALPPQPRDRGPHRTSTKTRALRHSTLRVLPGLNRARSESELAPADSISESAASLRVHLDWAFRCRESRRPASVEALFQPPHARRRLRRSLASPVEPAAGRPAPCVQLHGHLQPGFETRTRVPPTRTGSRYTDFAFTPKYR